MPLSLNRRQRGPIPIKDPALVRTCLAPIRIGSASLGISTQPSPSFWRPCNTSCRQGGHATPQKKIGKEIPSNQRNKAKQVPSALDLSPRPQRHLPFGCSVVGVMWKRKISLNFQKVFSSLGIYMVPEHKFISDMMQWSNGTCLDLQEMCTGSDRGPSFPALFVTCPEEKNGFHCTNKACRKKINAHRLPIPI